jgi:integrase
MESIVIIKKSDGKNYSVRRDRHRYFFPDEWEKFIKIDNSKHYLYFLTSLHTGGRSMEILHLKPKNFDFNKDRPTIEFEVIKQRKAKKNFYATGKTRRFFVSSDYIKEVKKYVTKYKIDSNDYIFLNKKDLPNNYDELSNLEKKKYYQKTEVAYNQLLKRRLKSSGITDWRSFSLHNIRKTYGNWMRIYDIKTEEICYRLGHDFETYLTHYGSPLIFTPQDKIKIMQIMGNVK